MISGCSFHRPPDGAPSSSAPASSPSAVPRLFEQGRLAHATGGSAAIGVSGSGVRRDFSAGNLGVSFESSDLADSQLDPVFSNLAEQLRSLGSPALRFDGKALDRRTFWTSKGERPQCSEERTIAPGDLKCQKKLVDATRSTVTLGIPLGTYDPKRGADMAAYAVDILGDSLVGLAIGDEPNGYTVKDVPNGNVRGNEWNKEKCFQQLEAYAEAIHKR